MKRIVIALSIALSLFISCSTTGDKPSPVVKYELSGGAGHYDYAPSFIIDEYGIIYGFLCENKEPFKIVDYIYLYKGIPTENGYVWQPGTEIVAPSKDGWDDCHICDPDVREFKTTYNGETYNWIMTYLGVDQWDCNHNQIGLAVSKNIEGPYIKFDGNPLVPYAGRDKWGTGQSTTIVKDSTTIMLFYHSTTENGPFCYREIKLNDLNNIVVGEEIKIPFFQANTYPTFSDDYIFMVSERRGKQYDASVIPTWVGDECVVKYKPKKGGVIAKDASEWTEMYVIGPEHSGFPRNHNPGFLTDTKGYLPDPSELTVYFTPAVTGEDWLWSYDLYSAKFDLSKFIK